eukprot:12048125-Alexandrium_andersonii.AAC.1
MGDSGFDGEFFRPARPPPVMAGPRPTDSRGACRTRTLRLGPPHCQTGLTLEWLRLRRGIVGAERRLG